MKPFFDSPLPRVFAHRGLALEAPENTPLAFAAAIAVGADYVETDVQASRDGVAIVAHDEDLGRLTGESIRIADLTAADLAKIDLGHGEGFSTLLDVLHGFPETRFNIDIKALAAAAPAVEAIRRNAAIDRVLIGSFDERRRRAAVDRLPGVATSATRRSMVPALAFGKVGLSPAVRRALRGIDAVQMPERGYGVSIVTPRVLRALRTAVPEIHVWTVNDPVRMAELFDLGVDAVITDRADLAVPVALARRAQG